MKLFKQPGKETVRPAPGAASGRRFRLKTGSAPLIKSLDAPSTPAPTPTETKPGPPISIAGALRRLKDAVAPAHIAAALGLPPGATNAEAIAHNLITKASMPDCDAATIRALLDRLAEFEPREPVQITVVHEDAMRKLLDEDGDPSRVYQALLYWTNLLLDRVPPPPEDVAVAAGRLVALLQGKGAEIDELIREHKSTVN